MKKLNRGWVKNAAIIFLIVLLLLTFFSNTIMNISLPEVATAQPQSGTITNAIRGNATVESMGSYSVEVDTPRQILAVYVREGDTVQQGEPLFRLEAGENTLVDQLRELQLRYQKMLLDMAGSDYAQQNESIRQAREDLQLAQAERAALGAAEITLPVAQARLDEVTATLATRNTRMMQLELELTYIDTLDVRSAYIGQAVLAYDQALADFFQNMGMSYDEFIAANPGASNEWTIAVETAESNMHNQAAAQRAVVVGEINAQAVLVSNAEAAVTQAQNTLTRIQRIDAADATVRSAQRVLNQALISLSDTQQQDSVAHAQRLLELGELQREISELEERIQRQDEDADGGDTTVTARYDGVIVNLTAVAGQTANPGIPLTRIEVAQMGFVAELSVDARQATEIRPGTRVEVGAGWFGVDGMVSSIRPDPDNPANRRIVSVQIEEGVFVGDQVNLTIPISSSRYDSIVPRSAIAQDAQGYHIYVLHARSSPLGTRYTARRIEVTIEAEDDTSAAVRGDLEWGVNVIIRSSAPLSDRTAVRLATD